MIDGVINGTGDSRYLKSSFSGTFEEMLTELAAGTFPIDLNGLNNAGWATLGTLLNKANLLTDATATALGGVSTVNEALAAVRPIALGGTSATTAAGGLHNLVSGTSAPAGGVDGADEIGLVDTSASTGAKISFSDLLTWLVTGNFFARIEAGYRTGTGSFGDSNPTTITFTAGFTPKVGIIQASDATSWGLYVWGSAKMPTYVQSLNLQAIATASTTSNTLVYSQSSSAAAQLNASGVQYYWAFIG